jgi:hypothetical protein
MVDARAGTDAAKAATAQAIQYLTNAVTGDRPPMTNGQRTSVAP